MNRDEADHVLARMVAIWPTPAPGEETLIEWREELRLSTHVDSLKAIEDCKAECEWWPSFATFRELEHRARSGRQSLRGLPAVSCAVCEDGFVTVSETGRSTVRLCPNGCKANRGATDYRRPMSGAERETGRRELPLLVAALAKAKRMPQTKRPA